MKFEEFAEKVRVAKVLAGPTVESAIAGARRAAIIKLVGNRKVMMNMSVVPAESLDMTGKEGLFVNNFIDGRRLRPRGY